MEIELPKMFIDIREVEEGRYCATVYEDLTPWWKFWTYDIVKSEYVGALTSVMTVGTIIWYNRDTGRTADPEIAKILIGYANKLANKELFNSRPKPNLTPLK